MVYKASRFHDGRHGSAITIKIIPMSHKNAMDGISEDGTVIIKVKSPLDEDKINTALINFLAKMINVSKNQIEIIAGKEGTEKLVAILGIDPDELHKRIMNYQNDLDPTG